MTSSARRTFGLEKQNNPAIKSVDANVGHFDRTWLGIKYTCQQTSVATSSGKVLISSWVQ